MKIYSKKFNILMQILGLSALIILLIANILKIVLFSKHNLFYQNSLEIFALVVNFIVCVFCAIFIMLPNKLELVSFVCTMYAFLISVTDKTNPMNVLMLYLALICFYVRGFYQKNKIQKIIISLVFYFFIIYFPLLFPKINSINILEKLGYSFICFFGFILLNDKFYKDNSEEKILNLAKYTKLTKRDAEWLNLIINKEKYENIAKNYEMSDGYVRARIRIVYEVLEVGDKIGFLNRYGNYTIVFDLE